MSLYYKQKLISGVRDVPSMTLAQYNALTNKPKLWIRTDAPEGDRGINADDIQYDNGTVKEALDAKDITITNKASTINYVKAFRVGNLVYIEFFCVGSTANTNLFTIEESARPSSNVTTMEWLTTDANTSGSKTFTLSSSTGNVSCDGAVYRGQARIVYTL